MSRLLASLVAADIDRMDYCLTSARLQYTAMHTATRQVDSAHKSADVCPTQLCPNSSGTAAQHSRPCSTSKSPLATTLTHLEAHWLNATLQSTPPSSGCE